MASPSTLQYTPLPERAQKIADSFIPSEELIQQRTKEFADVKSRPPNSEGDTEILDGAIFTHHFVAAPGDAEVINWHYVEAGPAEGEAIVFLHGIPDSWYQWHHQIAALSEGYRCIAVDLKGYGQSEKGPGDYRHKGAAEQLFTMLQQIGLIRFNLVTHDRGTVQGDYIVAKHPDHVIRYGRGEQHLYHFNPLVAPQGELFKDAPYTGLMDDPVRFVVWVHSWVGGKPIPKQEFKRIIQEYSHPGISKAVPRYFNSSTFRTEWLERRNRLLNSWKCPVLIMQGYDSKSQPREFYENAREYIRNAKDVRVRYLPGGHFWSMESPQETTDAIKELMSM
jgi:pimeloyl-ACP methyl ester carboxylesterase